MSKQETQTNTVQPKKGKINIRVLTVTAMLSAVSFILMLLDFSIPIMPGFVKMDFSELPALIGAFSMGPLSGMMICLIKNILHLFISSTVGVGEVANFVLGAAFVVPAGLVYTYRKTKKGAIVGALAGALVMAVISVFTNYFIVYPAYTKVMNLPMEAIIGAYQAINSNVKNLWDALIWFNLPFNFVKGMCSVVITLFIYKPISPIIKGTRIQVEENK